MKRYGRENVDFLYMDTDFFLLEIRISDIYKDLYEQRDLHYDFSNFPPNHKYFDGSHKCTPVYFKVEAKEKIIEEYVGLGPKMYSVKLADGSEH